MKLKLDNIIIVNLKLISINIKLYINCRKKCTKIIINFIIITY